MLNRVGIVSKISRYREENASRPSRPPTRRDVAKAAGVSPTTVTHALNPPPGARVKPETRRRIRRIAREMGYRPSFVGRALVSGKTYTVGLLQPAHGTLFYALYQQVLLGMVQAMDADDYNILTLFRSEDDRYLRAVRQGRVDGMFILQSDRETRCIEKVIATGIPTVVVKGLSRRGGPGRRRSVPPLPRKGLTVGSGPASGTGTSGERHDHNDKYACDRGRDEDH